MERRCAGNVNLVLMWPDSQAGQCRRRKAGGVKSSDNRPVPRPCPLAAGHTSAGDTEQDGTQLSGLGAEPSG